MTSTEHHSTAPDFQSIASIEDGCERLGRFLGLDGPTSRDVFVSTVEDPTYANTLFTARTEPAFRDHLLSRPTRCWAAANDDGGGHAAGAAPAVPGDGPQHSTLELLGKAARSFAVWTSSGFKVADDTTYQRRLAACAACPHHSPPPAKLVYQLAATLGLTTAERKVCALCGCITDNKARLGHESCPDEDAGRPGFTRWGEPLHTPLDKAS